VRVPAGATPFYVTVAALAALGAAVLWLQPYSAHWPGTAYAKPAQRYLQAAIRQDSTALARLSTSDAPVAWALMAARTRGGSLGVWAHHAQAWVGVQQGDTAEVFVFNASRTICPERPIRLRFVRSEGHAQVVQASSACFDAP
jgi:hypothetical protein